MVYEVRWTASRTHAYVDAGLINKTLDLIESAGGNFYIVSEHSFERKARAASSIHCTHRRCGRRVGMVSLGSSLAVTLASARGCPFPLFRMVASAALRR